MPVRLELVTLAIRRVAFRACAGSFALLGLACAHSDAAIRYSCLGDANDDVDSDIESEAHERLVRELYLRCLESRGIPDAPPRSPER